MSGPWDRPSQDREPLASDQDATPERPEAGTPSGEAWPSSDLWSDQRPGAGSGWDDWSTLRDPDDFVLDEPVSTLGDPWSESWAADEAAGREEASAPSGPDRWSEPPPERWEAPGSDRPTDSAGRWGEPAEEPMPRAPEPEPDVAPAPAWSPADPAATQPAEAAPRSSARDPEPVVDPWGAAATIEPASVGTEAGTSVDEPRVAPWQASDDPWGAVVEPDEPAAAVSPPADEAADVAAIDDEAAAASAQAPPPTVEGSEPSPVDEPEPATTSGGWRRELLPSWLTGRAATAPEPGPTPAEPEGLSAALAGADAMPVAGTDIPALDRDEDAVERPAAAVPATDAPVGEPVAEVAGTEATEPPASPSTGEGATEDEVEAHAPTPAWTPAPAADTFAAEIGLEPAPDADAGVAWEDDVPAAVLPAASLSEESAPVDVDVETEAAAEIEAAPSSTLAGWPEADVVEGPPPAAVPAERASTVEDGEVGDSRFDAWLGAPAGAAAAALPETGRAALPDADLEPVDDDLAPVDESVGAVVPDADELDVVEPPDLVRDGAGAELESAPARPSDVEVGPAGFPDTEWSAEAGETTDIEDAWVAEPESWEPAAVAPVAEPPVGEPDAWPSAAEPVIEAGPDEGGGSSHEVEPWAAAAAGAAAGMVGGTPSAAAEPEATPAEPSAPAVPGDAAAGGEVAAPAGPQPTWRPDWLPDLDASEAEDDEHTRVLPTDWTPPPATVAPIERGGELAPHATATRTRPASEADRDLDADAEPDASTAEQAVPWLIGFILLLAGMVIVLLALIFAGDASLGGGSGGPTPRPSLAAGVVGSPSPSPVPSGSAAASPTPAAPSASASPAASDGAVGGPAYGPIEMVYQGRAAALAPIYLLHREFTTEPEAEVLAQDPNLDLRRYAWAMDGTRGAGMYADLLVSIEPGVEKRQLADGISAVTFGSTPDTVYAVRVTQEGADDVATVLAVDFASGAASELARLTYARPAPESRAALAQAQYEDEGGPVRLFWMEDNHLRLWVLNGGMWEIDPSDGSATEVPRRPPLLWSPDGRQQIVVSDDGSTSILTRIDMDGNERAAVTVEGLVSHVRWSPESDRIVFTLGRSAEGGGVLQDLYLWDLGDEAPTQITATGAAFGAEWMGSRVRWAEDPG